MITKEIIEDVTWGVVTKFEQNDNGFVAHVESIPDETSAYDCIITLNLRDQILEERIIGSGEVYRYIKELPTNDDEFVDAWYNIEDWEEINQG